MKISELEIKCFDSVDLKSEYKVNCSNCFYH